MNSIKLRKVVKKSSWWKRRSTLERGLLVAGLCSVLIAAGFTIAFAVVVTKSEICLTPECIHTASAILERMNVNVDPCDNFYQFTCGSFLKNTVIPDDKTSITSFNSVSDKVQEQVRTSIEKNNKPNDSKHINIVKTFYKACMNKTAIEERGLAPLWKHLKDLGGWPVLEGNQWNDNEFIWNELVYKFRKAGESVDYIMDFSVRVDDRNSTKHLIYLDQPYYGLPQKYLKNGLTDKIISAYYSCMVDIAVLLGADKQRAARELKESLEFQIKLANITLPSEKRRNITALYNPMTVREMMQKFPTIPWLEYFNKMLAPMTSVTEDEIVIVKVPSFITDLEDLLEQVPKRTQANYLMWRMVADSVWYLTNELRQRYLAFSRILTGKTEEVARWKECTNLVTGYLSASVGALYVRQYFNEDVKKKASEMVSDVKQQFINILQTVDWMDDETRKAALDKVESMTFYIAYPDELLDDKMLDKFYKKLEITPGNYFESKINLSLYYTEYQFERLRKPVNKSHWLNHAAPAMVNAFYWAFDNSIELPAGILQGVFFNNERPRYMNYGAIGVIMGHEVTHGFDDRGSQYDKDGNLFDWWGAETKEKYLKKVECIISQYGNYNEPEVNLNVNGINTQGENIADNGGLKEAYLAYNEWVRRNGEEPRLPGLDYNSQQMFWISMANTWCSKYRPEQLKLDVTAGFHSPTEFRVIGSLSNMPEFAQDFNCPIGSPMNPEKKCVVW